MSAADNNRADDWRASLPPYGQATEPPAHPTTMVPPVRALPGTGERRRRSHAGGWFLALGVGAAVTALAVFSLQDPRSLGTQLDAAVSGVRGVGGDVGQTVSESQSAAVQASHEALNGVTTAIDDSAISLKVKTALAADPALSATRIEVATSQGIVRLEGPAPDAAAKERATVLAGAPQGVRGVDNRLALPQPGNVVAVAEGVPRAQPAAASR